MTIIKGISGAPGIACGKAYRWDRRELIPEKRFSDDLRVEWERAEQAMLSAKKLIEKNSGSKKENQLIVSANAQVLDDPELRNRIREVVFQERVIAEWAVYNGFEEFAWLLENQGDDYLSVRAGDLRELSRLVLAGLSDHRTRPELSLPRPAVVISDQLSFMDLSPAAEPLFLGICLGGGNRNDHGMIMARSLGIPAVLGLGDRISEIGNGVPVLVDGDGGEIIVDPDRKTLKRYRVRLSGPVQVAERNHDAGFPPVKTADGVRIRIAANISSVRMAASARVAGSEGIGLLRTEFLFAGYPSIPDEEEQYRLYQEIADQFPGQEVIIRLFDLGSDKPVFNLKMPSEANPALGLRGIRLALAHPDTLLRPQLMAILRILRPAKIMIMIPMVTHAQEVIRCREILHECQSQLGNQARQSIELGVMIEVPAAAIVSDYLAQCSDFFSIGTNDLIQYMSACDRLNDSGRGVAAATEIALLRLISLAVRSARQRRIPVSSCGEWGQSPENLAKLVGLGIDRISVNPGFIAKAQTLITGMDETALRGIMKRGLQRTSRVNLQEEIAAVLGVKERT